MGLAGEQILEPQDIRAGQQLRNALVKLLTSRLGGNRGPEGEGACPRSLGGVTARGLAIWPTISPDFPRWPEQFR